MAGLNLEFFRQPGTPEKSLSFGGTAIANLFSEVSESDADGALDAAVAGGIRHFDTAPYYGYGLSETRMGKALRALPRKSFVVSTKVGYILDQSLERESERLYPGVADLGIGFDYSTAGIMRSLDESLERLGLAKVDIVLVHDLDPTVHRNPKQLDASIDSVLSDSWPTLRRMRRDGAVSAIGFGINHAPTARFLIERVDADIVLLAGRYTLLEHRDALPFFRTCDERDVKVLIGGPFNSGLLASGSRAPSMYDYARPDTAIIDRVRKIEAVCERHGVKLAAAALQFAFGQRSVISVVAGMRSASEVKTNLELMSATISAAFWDDMREEGIIADTAPTP